MGVDAGPFTLAELVWMAEGRGRDLWAHTSAVLALVANVHRDPKKSQSFKPADFNPHLTETKRRSPLIKTKDLSILKTVFVKTPQQRSNS